MTDPRITDAIDSVKEIRQRLQDAVAIFAARSDEELAGFSLGGSGAMQTPATRHEMAETLRQSEAAIVGARIAILDTYLAALAKEPVSRAALDTIERFTDAWEVAERNLARLSYSGTPSVDPEPLTGDDGPHTDNDPLPLDPTNIPTITPASGPIPQPETSPMND